MPIMKKIF